MTHALARPVSLVCAVALSGFLTPSAAQERPSSAQLQVLEAERAFARTMADRDAEAFATFVSVEAVFFGPSILRGKQQVVEGWAAFFDGPDAPFAWAPEHVEVLPSGRLAHSSGPIYDPAGERVGTFNSVWRLEQDGRWRVVFDKGCSCAG